jgi:dihydrofolate reductase
MRSLAAIFALGENGAFGRSGGLPWHYPEDAKYFDDTTRGHAVVMGRRTWEERGKPLEERHNIVVSRTLEALAGAYVAADLEHGLAEAYAFDDIPFVIGGAALLRQAMPLVTRVYLTRIPLTPDADTFLYFDAATFKVVSTRKGESGVVFSVLERGPPIKSR